MSGGRIVYERYHDPVGATDIADSYSVSKSFTSAVIGLLTGDGALSVDDRAARPEWSEANDPRHDITVADLLHMASGLEWSEGTVDYPPFFGAPSAAAYAASKPLVAPPNTVFNYSTGTTAILASLAAQALGGPDALERFLRSRLLDPVGISSTQLMKDPSGMWYGGLGANSTPRDFARFGLLFLRDGMWDGERILPEGWVDYSRTPSDANPRYGAQWWIGPDNAYFEARGLGGQRIRVIPDVDAVVVITTQFDEPAADELATRVTELLLGA